MGPQVGAQKLGLPGRDSAEGMGTLSISTRRAPTNDAEPTRKVRECDLCGRAT